MSRLKYVRSLCRAVLFLILACAPRSASSASPNDVYWSNLYGLPGADCRTRSTVQWGANVYVGGEFSYMNGVPASRIARWDGVSWSPLGLGTNDAVVTMCVWNNQLVVGGNFTTAGGSTANRIAVWNGSTWGTFGTGMDAPVWALAVFNGDLVAAGDFVTADGNSCSHIARWTGTTWAPLGTGSNGRISALAAFTAPGCGLGCASPTATAYLYAGGAYSTMNGGAASNIARWDGGTWSTLAAGTNGAVRALAVNGPYLYVGGDFTLANSVANTNHIALWDDTSWSAASTGLAAPVYALATYAGSMYAGGQFTTPAAYISRFTGSAWVTVGTGGVNGFVDGLAATTLSGLVVVGEPTEASGVAIDFVGSWNGSTWSGIGGPLGAGLAGGAYGWATFAMTEFGGNLIVGGAFNLAGGTSVGYIAQWNGSSWSPLGSGFNGAVHALCVHQGVLYAGGYFSLSGATPVTNVARWTGSSWQPLGTGVGPGTVLAMTSFNNELVVAGQFWSAGGAIATRDIAAWTGTAWHNLGNGFDDAFDGDQVNALGIYTTPPCGLGCASPTSTPELYAGGTFTLTGNVPCRYLAKLSGGTSWQQVGALDGAVNALLPFNNLLVAGGVFWAPGFLGAWNGYTFATYNYFDGGTVSSLGTYNSKLVAGGLFPGAPAGNSVSRELSGTWTPLGDGLEMCPLYSGPFCFAIQQHGTSLFVGGQFFLAGLKPSMNIAEWNDANVTSSGEPGGATGRGALLLARPNPNPARGASAIRFSLTRPAMIELDVLDARGVRIAQILHGVQGAGEHLAHWDGRDASGRTASAGIYSLRLRGAGETVTQKLMRVE